MGFDVKPGWYRSKLPFLRNAVKVHCVSDGMVYYTRRGIAHMSIRSIKSFVEIVELQEQVDVRRKNS